MGLTSTLCERIAAVRYEDLPPEALRAGRRLVQDGLAVGIAGVAEEDAIPIMAGVMRQLGGNPDATVIGCGMRIDPVRAAALNGAAMHVLDFEPMWSPATHALSVTLPVALALAEARGLHGREVLTALIKGIEIQGWLRGLIAGFIHDAGDAAGGPEHLSQAIVRIAAVVGGGPLKTDVVEVDLSDVQHVEAFDHPWFLSRSRDLLVWPDDPPRQQRALPGDEVKSRGRSPDAGWYWAGATGRRGTKFHFFA